MMNQEQKKAYLTLHICVFIWGFTAILGNLINLQEVVLVWYRMGITTLSILCLPLFWKQINAISRTQFMRIVGVGILIAIHWITFYGSIKYSAVSVALVCIATVSFFTAFLEPLVYKSKINWWDVGTGAAIIPAIYLIFYFTGHYFIGIVLGLISAFFAALFTVLNKKLVTKHEPIPLTFLELGSGFVFISIIMPFYLQLFPEAQFTPTASDLIYLLLLSILCTTIPFILSLSSLKHLSAFTSNLLINLEPVYGIILASILFKEYEDLTSGFYFGTIIILLIVAANPMLKRIERGRKNKNIAKP